MTKAKKTCRSSLAGVEELHIFLNEASLQGQFDDESDFRVLLEALLSARSRSPLLAAMRTTPALAEREVSHGRSLRQVVQSWRGSPVASALLSWVGRNGPFIHDDRLHEDEDLFHCFGLEVTEGGLGEAGRRVKAGEDAAAMSFPGGLPNFAVSPLPVVHGFEEEPIATYEVANFWDSETALTATLALNEPAKTWEAMVEIARIRFPKLLLPDSIWQAKHLASQPFDAVIRDRTYALLELLNKYMEGRNPDGSEGPEAQEVLSTYFQGDRALFSPESTTNQNDFRTEMTFENPTGGGEIFAHWHGKISHRYFRIHFEWPVSSDADVLKVLYIGPKITKS